MHPSLASILSALGGAAGAAAAVVWLTKTLITQRLTYALDANRIQLGKDASLQVERLRAELGKDVSLEVERLRAELGKDVSLKVERLRAELAGAAKDREIRLSLFQERRARVLSAIYAHLADADAHNTALAVALERIGFEGQEKRAMAASDSIHKAVRIIAGRRLYLPPELADKLRDLANELSTPSLSYELYSRGRASRESVEEAVRHWNEHKDEVEAAQRVIEREFRELLEVAPAFGTQLAAIPA